ncbi:MAG: putative transcriptional regulator [Planctomycetota bacterium]|jgi:predicted transcriptional regulator
MADGICARDLMRTDFLRIRTDQTLGDAMIALRGTQGEHGMPSALMVVDGDDQYRGMLTARLLIRLLTGGHEEGREMDDMMLLAVARDRLSTAVGDVLVEDIAMVAPEDRLLTMIRRGAPMRLDFVPVVDDGRPVGFAPITAIFQAAAGLALTPEDEGIRFDR